MGVPLLLKAFAAEPGFRSYARVYRKVERELALLHAKPESAEILSKKDQRSALRKFFALEKATDADHWLAVNAQVGGRAIRFLGPFRRGLHLPYSLEIGLDVPASVTASLTRSLVLRPRWQVLPNLPENKSKAQELEALMLPAVGWRHESGGIPILLTEGGRIGNVVGERHAAWTVFSAFQGFIFNVGPRIARYVEAAPRLEALLREWARPPAPVPRAPEVPKPDEL